MLTLRIRCPQLLLHTALTPMLAKFHEEHRDITTKIVIENRMAQMLDLVRNDDVELWSSNFWRHQSWICWVRIWK